MLTGKGTLLCQVHICYSAGEAVHGHCNAGNRRPLAVQCKNLSLSATGGISAAKRKNGVVSHQLTDELIYSRLADLCIITQFYTACRAECLKRIYDQTDIYFFHDRWLAGQFFFSSQSFYFLSFTSCRMNRAILTAPATGFRVGSTG